MTVLLATAPFNVTVVMLSGVGALIEWRRAGHAIGRLLRGRPMTRMMATLVGSEHRTSGPVEAVTRSLGPSGASPWIRSSRGGGA